MTDEPDVFRERVRIQLASPDQIRQWSSGEVVRPGLLHPRRAPESGGLFCERIFGPLRDWCCGCVTQRHENGDEERRYWGGERQGHVCPQCRVPIERSHVRRRRMGHIELAFPVVHPWYLRPALSPIASLLDLRRAQLLQVVDFQAYLVLDAGDTPLGVGGVLDEDAYAEAQAQYGTAFRAGTGSLAVRERLVRLDLDDIAAQCRAALRTLGTRGSLRRFQVRRRLHLVEGIRASGNRLEWLILDCLPVLPPDLRPMQLLPGRGDREPARVTSDLNLLYQTILEINNRLREWTRLQAMEVLLRQERRRLQRAVDALFDNARLEQPIPGVARRPLRSLTDMLTGKRGRFRQNLLGKRVDFSGRAVIVCGPRLLMHQCGLPRVMARELFQPLLLGRLAKLWAECVTLPPAATVLLARLMLKGCDATIRRLLYDWLADSGQRAGMERARDLLRHSRQYVDALLEEVVKEQIVLLNRAPTLHRMNVQAFEPVLVEGKALQLSPLVCAGFNADFDGDTMAIHVPLSHPARVEAALLLRPANNLRSPANGAPLSPTNEIVLGAYYLTADLKPSGELVPVFASAQEVRCSFDHGKIGVHDWVVVRLPHGRPNTSQRLQTTVGRVLFDEVMPAALPFQNRALDRAALGELVGLAIETIGRHETVALLDRVKEIGFHWATRAGLSFVLDDLGTPANKDEVIARTRREVAEIEQARQRGEIDAAACEARVVAQWTQATTELTEALKEAMPLVSAPLAPVLRGEGTGVRGSAPAVEEYASPSAAPSPPSPLPRSTGGEGVRSPVVNNLVLMIQSGARGKWDQVRQLAALRGVMARASGSGLPLKFPIVHSLREGLTAHEFFLSAHGARKAGADRAALPESGALTRKLVDVAHAVVVTIEDCGTTEGLARSQAGRTPVAGSNAIRSPVTCAAAHGVCRLCYGHDPATGQLVEIGTPVGILAAQSIGEPGTQLAMRTKHTGGVVVAEDLVSGLKRVIHLLEAYAPRRCGERSLQQRLDDLGRNAWAVEVVEELQGIYRANGVLLADVHFEIALAQMIRKVEIVDGGTTGWLPGELVERAAWLRANQAAGQGVQPAQAREVVLGLSRAALRCDSFLSAASFQQTARGLAEAALTGRCDDLLGLKENVILGRLIPAGTGFRRAPSP